MKVDVATFSYRNTPTDSGAAITRARDTLLANGVNAMLMTYGNALVHQARNTALANRRKDADYLIMIDDDMMPEPEAFVKMIRHGQPVVSALCTTRVPPIRLCMHMWNPEKRHFCPVDLDRFDAAVRGPFAVGTGLICMSAAVVDELIEQYLSGADWMEENRGLFDRLEVSKPRREKERARIESVRREEYAKNPATARVFGYPVLDNQFQMGEDICLGFKLRWLERDVIVDPFIGVGHCGIYPYTWRDYEIARKHEQEQERKAA